MYIGYQYHNNPAANLNCLIKDISSDYSIVSSIHNIEHYYNPATFSISDRYNHNIISGILVIALSVRESWVIKASSLGRHDYWIIHLVSIDLRLRHSLPSQYWLADFATACWNVSLGNYKGQK